MYKELEYICLFIRLLLEDAPLGNININKVASLICFTDVESLVP